MELTEGTLVADRYRLDRKLGAGGMGEVWAATQTVTRMPVALKFLRDPDQRGASDDARRRFVREARAAVAVHHPNVVQIHDVIELPSGEPVMVMELLEGESLEQRLKRGGRIPLGELCAVMVRVVSAVGTAHQLGIVHRDLKPDNIFLAQTREGVEVKVLDFGIAKLTAVEGNAAETGGLTGTGAMLGTPFYMSPEQAFGEKKIDHRADLWSLGVILYRCLTGVLPTFGENIGQILKIIMTHAIRPLREAAPELPADVSDLVDRMLSQAPADRPADLREVKGVLERYAGVVVDASTMGETPKPPPPAFGAPLVDPSEGPSATAAGVTKPAAGDLSVEGSPTSRAATAMPGAKSTVVAPPGARRTVLTAIVGAIAVGLVIAVIFVKPKQGGGVAPEPPGSASPAITATPAPSAPPRASADAPAASAAPSASVLPAATVADAGAPSGKRPGRPATTAATTVEPAKEGPKPSMGGVIEKPPF